MTHHLKLVTHEHEWEAYTLSDAYGIYYTGYKCECGETGYAMPMRDPSGAVVTMREWHDHLDEEHEDDRQDRH